MKHLPLLLALIILLCSFVFNGFQANTKATVAINANKVNVFYIGVDNPVSVALSGVPIESTKVSIDKGFVTPTNQAGKYTIRVSEVGIVNIQLQGSDSQGKIARSSHSFRVKRIPNPVAKVGRKYGHFGQHDIRTTRGMIAVLENFDFDARFTILDYEVEYVREGDFVKKFQNQGGLFSPEIRKTLEDVQEGDLYYFDKIRVVGPDEKIRTLNSIHWEIREL